MQKPAETIVPIHELLAARWSPRAFSTQPVEEEKLLSLFEAARWAPSANNIQPWAFVVTRRDEPGCHGALLDTLTGQNPVWAGSAPVLTLVVALPNPRTGATNRYSYYDVGAAVAHLTVQAAALGLHVHQMGGFDGEMARQIFELPEGAEAITVLAIGYLGDANDLPEALRQRELAARARKPLGEFVFKDNWNRPMDTPEAELALDRATEAEK